MEVHLWIYFINQFDKLDIYTLTVFKFGRVDSWTFLKLDMKEIGSCFALFYNVWPRKKTHYVNFLHFFVKAKIGRESNIWRAEDKCNDMYWKANKIKWKHYIYLFIIEKISLSIQNFQILDFKNHNKHYCILYIMLCFPQ